MSAMKTNLALQEELATAHKLLLGCVGFLEELKEINSSTPPPNDFDYDAHTYTYLTCSRLIEQIKTNTGGL
jgi:hypothetical protein